MKHPSFTDYQCQLVRNWPYNPRMWSLCSLQLGRDATDKEVAKFVAARRKADEQSKAHWKQFRVNGVDPNKVAKPPKSSDCKPRAQRSEESTRRHT